MLLTYSSVTNLSLLFGFCAACMLSYSYLQMEWWAAVVIPSQPALLMWPCVSSARPSVLSPQASRANLHSRHPADCILPILIRKLAVGVIPATAIPKRLLRFHGIFLSIKYFPSIKFPASCLSVESATTSLFQSLMKRTFPAIGAFWTSASGDNVNKGDTPHAAHTCSVFLAMFLSIMILFVTHQYQ